MRRPPSGTCVWPSKRGACSRLHVPEWPPNDSRRRLSSPAAQRLDSALSSASVFEPPHEDPMATAAAASQFAGVDFLGFDSLLSEEERAVRDTVRAWVDEN